MAGGTVVIATGNLKHLESFAAARHWRDSQAWVSS